MEASLSVTRAIVFALDLANKNARVPEYIDGELIASNESCVSVGTQAEVDGAVTIKLSERLSDSEKRSYKIVFNGAIETPSKKLAIVTSEIEKILEMDVKNTKARVVISVDDLKFPSVVLVEVT